MWHADMKEKGEHCILDGGIQLATLKKARIIVPRQSYLFELDPTNTKAIDELRVLVSKEAV